MNSFNALKLPAPLEKALQAMSLGAPTPVQAQAIPVAMSNRDLMGCAPIGSGKTLAFSIPMITRLLKAPNKGALILIPTKESASEVMEVLNRLTVNTPEIKSAALVGGAPIEPQSKALSVRPRIIVATPDRLVEHLKKGGVSLSSMEILVLNEADKMLEKGFQAQLSEILRFLPRSRQTLLFSTTLPPEIIKMSEKWLREPVRVTIEAKVEAVAKPAPKAAAPKVAPKAALKVTKTKKVAQPIAPTTIDSENVLLNQLKARKGSVLVFTRTKSRTDILAKHLAQYGHPVARLKTIKGFRSGEYRILVATDVEARGLDISNIQHVINYDLLTQ
jgi:ATP-dependent RNA helicase DeaD